MKPLPLARLPLFALAAVGLVRAQEPPSESPENTPAPPAETEQAPSTLAGFNEDSLIEPLDIPPTLMLGYDPVNPLDHLDEQWHETFEALLNSGNILFSQERFTDTTFVLEQALRLAPDHLPTLNRLGSVYVQLRMLERAAEMFDIILRRDPDNWHARFNRSEMFFVSACSLDQQALNESPEDLAARRERLLRNALEGFEGLRSDPKHPDFAAIVDFKVFLIHLMLGELAAADEVQQQHDAFSGSPAWYMMNADREFELEDDPEAATEWIGSARRVFPSSEVAVFLDSFIELDWADIAVPE